MGKRRRPADDPGAVGMWWDQGTTDDIGSMHAQLGVELSAAASMGPSSLAGAFVSGMFLGLIDPDAARALIDHMIAEVGGETERQLAIGVAHRVRAGWDRTIDHFNKDHPEGGSADTTQPPH